MLVVDNQPEDSLPLDTLDSIVDTVVHSLDIQLAVVVVDNLVVDRVAESLPVDNLAVDLQKTEVTPFKKRTYTKTK